MSTKKPFNLLEAIAKTKAMEAKPELKLMAPSELKLTPAKANVLFAALETPDKPPEETPDKPKPAVPILNIASAPKAAAPIAEGKRDILHGSGLTKRLAEASQKQILVQTQYAGNPGNALLNALAKSKVVVGGVKLPDAAAKPPEAKSIALNDAAKQRIETVDLVKAALAPHDEIQLDEYQLAALEGMRAQQFCCLIGAAGTGKTTVTKQLARELEQTTALIDLRRANPKYVVGVVTEDGDDEIDAPDWNIAIAFMGFTGRSVEQMKFALPAHYHKMCDTIHGHLGFMPEFEDVIDEVNGGWKKTVRFYPTFNAARKLPYKVIVIDEASMVPVGLWNQLMDAITPDVRIILIGDINQLPPVMGRSVFGYAMTKWPVYALEKIHRQAEGNPIIANAHKILQGLFPARVQGKFDMYQLPSGGIGTFNAVNDAIMQLSNKKQFDPLKDAMIVPMNKGVIGQLEFNQRLVTFFNPETKIDGIIINRRHPIIAGKTQYALAVGDKVMVTKNNREKGLTNGMTGIITEINLNGNFNEKRSNTMTMTEDDRNMTFNLDDLEASLEEAAGMDLSGDGKSKSEKDDNQRQASHVVTVQFTNGSTAAFATAGAFKTIMHAYAFTCHKAQGSEFPTVVIILHSANAIMLCREWLYTAVTRARGRVILLYNDAGLQKALRKQRITGRTIAEKIKAFIAWESENLAKGDDDNIPYLSDPRKYDVQTHVTVEH